MRERLHQIQGEPVIDPALLADLDHEQAAALLLGLLEDMKVSLSFGTRPPEEIVNRMVRKLRRDDPEPLLQRALHLLGQLSQIRNTPAEALQEAHMLLKESGLPTAALDELQAILALLDAHGVRQDRLVLDFGLGRGLHYYTGMIFEIYDQEGMQLTGGGRYDELVAALGGSRQVPAVGFTYGLERVAALTPAPAHTEPRRKVLVAAVADADYGYALEVARRLRAGGFVVSVDVRRRSLANNLRDADRRNVAYVAVVGDSERADQVVLWRDLVSGVERRLTLDDLRALHP
jgi:histidyl-tRNA synthetase